MYRSPLDSIPILKVKSLNDADMSQIINCGANFPIPTISWLYNFIKFSDETCVLHPGG